MCTILYRGHYISLLSQRWAAQYNRSVTDFQQLSNVETGKRFDFLPGLPPLSRASTCTYRADAVLIVADVSNPLFGTVVTSFISFALVPL